MTNGFLPFLKYTIVRHSVRSFLAISLLMHAFFTTNAQVGVGTNKPDSSAALHVNDTARGLLIPRMTTLQKNKIHNPAEGLMIYQTDSARGFWYFTGGQWRNMVPANDGGKQTIVLSGNITNSEAAAKIAAEYGPSTQAIRIIFCSQLTTVDLSMVTNATEIYIYLNPVLQTVNLSNLLSVETAFNMQSCPVLTSVALNSLQKISQGSSEHPGFNMISCNIRNLNFPALKEIAGDFVIMQSDSLTSVSFPALQSHNGDFSSRISIQSNANLTSISFPVLNKASLLDFESNPKLVTLSAPSLSAAATITFNNNNATGSLSFPSLTTANYGLDISNNNALTTAAVPALSTLQLLTVNNNLLLGTFSAPALTKAATIALNDMALTSVAFNALTSVETFDINSPALAAVTLPLLTTANSLTIGGAGNAFTSFSAPHLTNVQTLTLNSNNSLATVALPVLTIAGNLTVQSTKLSSFTAPALTTAGSVHLGASDFFTPNTVLLSLALPALTSLTDSTANSQISFCSNLTSIGINSLTSFANQSFSLHNKLPSSQVNALLNKFVSIVPPLTGKTFDLQQYVPAPPTGQGITDKATLVARPNTVITN